MEPSVIFIGNCDRMFTKKLDPEIAELKPARMKSELTKAMKFITAEDRILVVGTSKYPFKAQMKPMMKMFQRLIFIYPPSHGSRRLIWEHMIKNFKGEIGAYSFDLSSIAKVSQGFTAGAITNAISEVLTEKRIKRQLIHPLKTIEFVNRIATFDPVWQTELAEFKKWLNKTPLAKTRSALTDIEIQGQNILNRL